MLKIVATMLVAASLTAPALASDRNGYQAIAAGDFAGAARRIEAERRIFPQRPELMLNLAVAYTRTGRIADARDLYDAVLRRPAVAMDMPDGSIVSSHDVATRGLARIPTAHLSVATR